MRIIERDFQSYCNILLDDNRNRRVCRFYFNSSTKYLGLPLEDNREEKVEVDDVSDVYKYTSQLRARIRQLEGIAD